MMHIKLTEQLICKYLYNMKIWVFADLGHAK